MTSAIRPWLRALALAVLVALGACAPRTEVVLMPDPDGRVGQVLVANPAGAQTLSAARTGVVAGRAAPEAPAPVAQERIAQVWGAALAAQPPPPAEFLLYFRTGGVDLTPPSVALIPQIVDRLRGWPFPRVAVAGHTDATGSDATNMALSRRRAAVVRDLLVAAGIPAAAIEVSSHGKRNPLVPTPDGVAEPRNRRVTVTIR